MKPLPRVQPDFRLADIDPDSTPGTKDGKSEGTDDLADGAARLAELQELLFANGKFGDERRVLLVIQAMDTAGKGGIVQHVVGAVDPEGVHVHAFKAPTPEEAQHDFLWRIRQQLPEAGQLGVFDRSHYEDVLIRRVHRMDADDVIDARYQAIADFERELVAGGTTLVKVMLHISRDEQKERLLARLDDPTKHWKYSPGDVAERAHWDDYMAAYQLAIRRTTTDAAPWYVVPANKKWYARIAVQQLLVSALEGLQQDWPKGGFDVADEKARVSAS